MRPMTGRICDWCRGPLEETARRDAICCSKRCRQARHRFRSAIAGSPVAAGQPRRLAYADPPYPGKSHYYRDHPDYAGEVDHAELVASLSAEYDAWALSTSAAALQDVLALCPPGVRVAAWFRGERPNQQAQLPQNAWEPVIYAGDIRRLAPPALAQDPDATVGYVARVLGDASRSTVAPTEASRQPGARVVQDLADGTVAGISCDTSRSAAARHDASRGDEEQLVDARRIDTLIYPSRPRLTDPGRVIGAKPAAFCRWIFDLLGATPADTLVDVFPGSAGVSRAWSVFCEEAIPA